MSAQKTVGAFTLNGGTLTGPAEYMRERGNARLERILAGNDAVFNASAIYSGDAEIAIIVSLQTDYAGWLGTRRLLALAAR